METDTEEGGLSFEVEGTHEDGHDEGVFYNPVQELNRDLTVAVLRAYPEWSGRDVDSYLDATAASGVRGVRAASEGYDAVCCDVDPDAVALAERNFARNDLPGEAVHRKAQAYMHESHFDVVDLDPFGTPIPFADAAVDSANALLCVTATDTAPLCGAHFRSGVRTYSAVPRNTEFHAEMGVRVLLSALVRTAARYDVAARPVFTHATSHYVRTYLHLDSGAQVADEQVDELGHVDWCQDCYYREHERGLLADPLDSCPVCGGTVQTAGPLYLGRPDDPDFLAAVAGELTDELGTRETAERLLERIAGELDRPTHYDQHRLYRNWSEPAIGMDEFLEGLREAGFEASRTHYGGTTLKTDATPAEMRDLFVE
ncbi:tRNA (guanine(26)-N(2))-dimethyltransferase [Salinirubellus salinus]|jgi:tRNA (guanine26-N2/guanine27-N2)-dimethyltransferase|uniref:tRNA (guanine(26)-N(2))-dimethyltransferase n=1 Tax=Salinirubellus salinus TaxID=1364945 RepID=A0A9E7U925_9EURY|nr:tRNA (guanine(26)-N(2))-dimethyltransferase [Salinirubellus salinus]UWM52848.1 tRNA (guanine(26)-N(2))-dimethyltransferase [Salinirubellus salinus]